MVLCLLIPTLQGAATVGHASGAGNPQVRSSLQHSRVDGSPTLFAVDERTTHVVVLSDEPHATLSILDGRSGALLHTVRVEAGPVDLAVDDATRRIFADGRAFFVLNPAFPTDNSAPQTSPVYVHLLDTGTGATVGAVEDESISSDTILQHNTVLAGFGVDAVRHRVFAINPSGANGLVVFDPRNGRVIHAFSRSAVFVTSTNLVVDQQTGKVFFGTAGDAHGSVGILDASRL